ncbi:alpha/beta fold hydrolase [Rhodococcus sp. MEB064]|uniref:alpha/beta fold hydrolase n=1 Tax=Rhodococcus sp. MEB064 TaxID=1587522 RepID=UPI0005AC7AF2|nr:alpha/beta hydrolase [Rhodococcus sp. MEB064]KIQ18461.1 alpha/beta hydrolase [Rhodococcus sp. MEB064]
MTAQEPRYSDRFIDLPNFRVHYIEAGTGHPVVLLHGAGPGATSSTNFSPSIGALAEHFRVIAPDMPGWGESDTQNDDTGRDHTAVLIALLDALDIPRAALVGNSMGGITAFSTSIAHPDRVSHLITMGTPAPTVMSFSPGNGPTEGMAVLLHAYREPTAENMKRLVQVMCFDQSMATDELAQARAKAAEARPDHLANWNSQFTGTPAPWPYLQLADKVRSITAPTLVIHGRDDRVVPLENSLHLVTRIPNSRAIVLNRCGHWAQIEHAAEFNQLVTSFING